MITMLSIFKNVSETKIKNRPTFEIDLASRDALKLEWYDAYIPLDLEMFKKWFSITKNLILNLDKTIIQKRSLVYEGVSDSSYVSELDRLSLKINFDKRLIQASNKYDGMVYINGADKRFIYRFDKQTQQADILLVDMFHSGINRQFMNDTCPVCHHKLNSFIRNFAYQIKDNKMMITHLPCALKTNDLNSARLLFGDFSFFMFQLIQLEKINTQLEERFNTTDDFNNWFAINRFGIKLLLYCQRTFASNAETELDKTVNRIILAVQQKKILNLKDDEKINQWTTDYKKQILNNISSEDFKNDFCQKMFRYNLFLRKKIGFSASTAINTRPQSI